MDNNQEIDFTKVDWNNLTKIEFHKLSNVMNERAKINKTKKIKPTGSKIKFVTVQLMNKNYSITEALFMRIKNCKNEATKNKLINEIILSNNPIIEL